MRVNLDCGCNIDDKYLSTVHHDDGKHYPLGTSPENYCKKCDLFKIAGKCLCPPKLTAVPNPENPK